MDNINNLDINPPALPPADSITAEPLGPVSIRISWSAVLGAQSYYLFRGNNPEDSFENVGKSETTEFIDTELQPETIYYYKVAAFNGIIGNCSDNTVATTKSEALEVTQKPDLPANKELLPAPQNPVAIALSSSEISVSWDSVEGALNYNIYISRYVNGPYSLAGNSVDTVFNNSGLAPGTAYYIKIAAIDSNGTKGEISSNAAVATLQNILPEPKNFAATVLSTDSISVTWETVQGANGYNIYRSLTGDGEFELLTSTVALSYVETGLAPETDYYYMVAAYALGVEGTRSITASAATFGIPKPPVLEIPKKLKAYPIGCSCISVIWDPVKDAEGYHVYRSGKADGVYEHVDDVSEAEFIDNYLSNDTEYFYKISAFSDTASSMPSGFAYAMTTKDDGNDKYKCCFCDYYNKCKKHNPN